MAHLSIGVLGSLQISIDDQPLARLESDKVRALLVYLAVEADHPHSRDQLLGLLWPDYPEPSARHSLRQALFNLRQILGDQAADPPYLLISRDTIQFNRASDYSLDLDQFNTAYVQCDKHLSQCEEDCSFRAARLEEMVRLYRGEFLAHFYLEDSTEFEEWSLIQRENLHQRVLEAHSFLANYYEGHADFPSARRHAQRQLELDPWREEAHCQLMRILALEGQRSAALAQYETCRKVLAEELGVEPSAKTRELYEQIRSGALHVRTEQPARGFAPAPRLPAQLTPFIGREQELAELGRLIADPECRCITLLGPGGTGKTRLALQAAEEQAEEFAQGAVFVPLAPVWSSAGVIPAVANAVQYALDGPGHPKIQILNYLSSKQMLLILDNLEQLLVEEQQQEEISALLVDILRNAPGVKLLATSREALHLQEEWIFEVHGLAYPPDEQMEAFDEFSAVKLFVQRARRASPGFGLDQAGRDGVRRICRLVEGMPLAIELAATWVRTLSPAEIADEIEASLDFLSASVRDLPERHRSMRAVFDQTWQMLSPDEQQALSQLSVFQGGFSRQAAEQVAGANLSVLARLVNRTLLRRAAGSARFGDAEPRLSPGRYELHELVRQYSCAHLMADPPAYEQAQKRHYDFFLAIAEKADRELKGRNQLEWLVRLEQERDNLRAALKWALQQDRDAPGGELGLRLASALRWFWRMRGHFHNGLAWLQEALQICPEVPSAARARALAGLALLVNGLGDLAAALPPAEASVAIYRRLDDQPGLAEALIVAGLTLIWQGEASQGCARLEEALKIARQAGDRWDEAQALFRWGIVLADYQGDSTGRAMLAESEAILEELGEKYLYVSVLISQGLIDMTSGDYAAARSRFEHSLTLSEEMRHPWGMADTLTNLGGVLRIRGDYQGAQARLEQVHQIYREHGSSIWEIDVLCALAENQIDQGDLPGARLHLQRATHLLQSSDNKWLQALVWYFRGYLAYYEGEAEEAAALLEEAARLAREGEYKIDLARSLVMLARARGALGQIELASELAREGLELFQELRHKLGIATALEGLATVQMALGDRDGAERLFGEAQALRAEMGTPLPPVEGGTRGRGELEG